MSRKTKLVKCKQKRHDCFACTQKGNCRILVDTNFKNHDGKTYKCPFYKKVIEALGGFSLR